MHQSRIPFRAAAGAYRSLYGSNPGEATERLRIRSTVDVVVLAGEIDAHTSSAFLAACVAQGLSDLNIDMRDVGFMDSSGVRVLVEVHRSLTSNGDRLAIVHPSRQITRVLELAGISELLGVTPDDVD